MTLDNKERSGRQNQTWLLTAMAAPLAQTASGASWLTTALVGAVCLPVCWGLEWLAEKSRPGKWLCAVQWFWLSLILGEVLQWLKLCWPDSPSALAAPLVLLLLAAWTAGKGKEQASRAGSVLFWFLTLLLGAVLLSGVKEIRLDNLRPVWKMQGAHLITVFLIPAMGTSLTGSRRSWRPKAGILMLGILLSTVTSGVLSLKAAAEAPSAFYELSRSLRLLGIAERFESLVAAGMTLGYFALLSYLLSAGAAAAEVLRAGKGAWGSWSAAVLSGLFFISGFRLDSAILALGTVLTWVVLPVLNCLQRNLQKM